MTISPSELWFCLKKACPFLHWHEWIKLSKELTLEESLAYFFVIHSIESIKILGILGILATRRKCYTTDIPAVSPHLRDSAVHLMTTVTLSTQTTSVCIFAGDFTRTSSSKPNVGYSISTPSALSALVSFSCTIITLQSINPHLY